MFQYALAISMDAEGIPTKISVNDFLLNRHYQGFELLKAFDVPMPIVDRWRASLMSRVRPLLMNAGSGLVKNTLSKLLLSSSNEFHEKLEYQYDEEVMQQRDSHLIGTWQCPKYFESQQQLIREVFNFNKPHDDLNLKFSTEIAASNAVAVHVRRGFYLEQSMSRSHMVIDSSDYYYKAFDLISQQVKNPVFYVFSDDIAWAKRNLKGGRFVFVSHNRGANSYLDMYLMSLCKHFVIANSAFSWWPAWLAPNQDKVVVVPKPWVRESDCPSIYLGNWQAIDVLDNQMEVA